MSSTTRNQSSSELQMGRNRNRDPPSSNRDEDPYLGSEDPPQSREELPGTCAALFFIKNITNHYPTVDPNVLKVISSSLPASRDMAMY